MEEKQKMEYVGFWARAGASLVDVLLFLLFTVPILYAIHGRDYFRSDILKRGSVDFLNSVVLPSLIIILFWFLCSATPGKMIISARIVDAKTGGKPKFRQLVIRYFGYYASALFFGLGFLRIPFTPRKQGWHDEFAGDGRRPPSALLSCGHCLNGGTSVKHLRPYIKGRAMKSGFFGTAMGVAISCFLLVMASVVGAATPPVVYWSAEPVFSGGPVVDLGRRAEGSEAGHLRALGPQRQRRRTGMGLCGISGCCAIGDCRNE